MDLLHNKISGYKTMPYTEEEGGRLNNFAREPKMYKAEPPTGNEKRNYVVLGVLAAVLVVGVIAVAIFAS
jgi:hypothetical protein